MSEPCKSCGAPLLWAITEKGRQMPLDPEPHPDGNLLVRAESIPSVTGAYEITQHYVYPLNGNKTADRYVSHLKVCPNRRS
ncbi:MAG: hypothetical protein NVS3B1_06210 [Marmoricola sp.]